MTPGVGPTAGWIALALIPLAAAAGWVLRRFAKGRFAVRMRPHAIVGYSALGFTIIHLAMSMGSMGGADATGIWLATLALVGLIAQAVIGANLQSPGGYRHELHRWHVIAFVTVLLLGAAHVVLNGMMSSMFRASETSPESGHRLRPNPAATWDLAAARSFHR